MPFEVERLEPRDIILKEEVNHLDQGLLTSLDIRLNEYACDKMGVFIIVITRLSVLAHAQLK